MILTRLYKIFGWSAIVAASVLILCRMFAASFIPNESQCLKYIQTLSPYPIHVESIKIHFRGWVPALKLEGIDLLQADADQRLGLTIQEADLVMDPLSLLFKKQTLNDVIIKGMKVRVRYDHETGSVWIPDLPLLKWTPHQTKSSAFHIKHLSIQDSDIHFIIDKHQSLPLANVDLLMNDSVFRQLKGQVTVLNAPDSKIQFAITFPLLGNAITKIYAHWEQASLQQCKNFFGWEIPSEFMQGYINVESWMTLTRKGQKEIISQFELSKESFLPGSGWIKAQGKDKEWNMALHYNASHIENAYTQATLNLGKAASERSPRSAHLVHDGGERAQPTQHKFKVERVYEAHLRTFQCEEAQCYQLQTSKIDIEVLRTYIDKIANVLEREVKYIDALKGEIGSFSAFFLQLDNTFLPLEASLAFNDLSMPPQDQLPGFTGVSGKVFFHEGRAQIHVNSDKISIEAPHWFEAPLHLSNIHTQWAFTPTENTKIYGKIDSLGSGDTIFSGKLTLDQDLGKVSNIDLSLKGTAWPLQQTLAVLPKKIMDPALTAWLERALQSGQICSTEILFKGDPQQFPFDDQEGLFEAKMILDNAKIDYDSAWPALENVKGELTFKNRSMQLDLKEASVAGGSVLPTQAVISDLGAKVAVLQVNTSLTNQLPTAINVIQGSPLKGSIGESLAVLDYQGEFTLGLDLTVPITHKEGYPVKMNGVVTVKDATVDIPNWRLQTEHVNGKVLFTEGSVSSEDLVGTLFDFPTNFAISTKSHEEHKLFEIQIKGHLEEEKLRAWLELPEYEFITGGADYLATIELASKQSRQPLFLKVQSLLEGIEVKAPPPFGKSSDLSRLSSLLIVWEPQKYADIHVEYGVDVGMALTFNEEGNKSQFKGGHLNLGNVGGAKSRSDGVFLIDGNIDEIDYDVWKMFTKEGASAKFEGEPLIAVYVQKLIFQGETFPKTQVEAQWDQNSALWNFNFDGPALKGHVALPVGEDQREIIVDLKKLTLASKEVDAESAWYMQHKVIERPIEVKIKKLKVNKKSIQDVQVRIEPSWRGYDIPRLQAKTKNTDYMLSGQWDVLSHQKKILLEGKIRTQNTSDLLKTLGMKGTVHRAKGEIDFSVSWQGAPFKIDFPTLMGKAEFRLAKGMVQGVDPGIGRVINILSLDSVLRRLSLDFSDVTEKGFAFDEFSGKFQFGKGKVSSNMVSLKGPSANIESYGQADLENQDVTGFIIVMPNVTGSLPVAAAIAAGNPAVGAAVWLVDKMVGKKLQEMHRYRYRLVGTWDSPKLEMVPSFPISRG